MDRRLLEWPHLVRSRLDRHLVDRPLVAQRRVDRAVLVRQRLASAQLARRHLDFNRLVNPQPAGTGLVSGRLERPVVARILVATKRRLVIRKPCPSLPRVPLDGLGAQQRFRWPGAAHDVEPVATSRIGLVRQVIRYEAPSSSSRIRSSQGLHLRGELLDLLPEGPVGLAGGVGEPGQGLGTAPLGLGPTADGQLDPLGVTARTLPRPSSGARWASRAACSAVVRSARACRATSAWSATSFSAAVRAAWASEATSDCPLRVAHRGLAVHGGGGRLGCEVGGGLLGLPTQLVGRGGLGGGPPVDPGGSCARHPPAPACAASASLAACAAAASARFAASDGVGQQLFRLAQGVARFVVRRQVLGRDALGLLPLGMGIGGL